MLTWSTTLPIFGVAITEVSAANTVAVVPSAWSPLCMKAGDPLLHSGEKEDVQEEGKTWRHLCQKHVGDRRGRPGAGSGYCSVLLVDCPKIRAR